MRSNIWICWIMYRIYCLKCFDFSIGVLLGAYNAMHTMHYTKAHNLKKKKNWYMTLNWNITNRLISNTRNKIEQSTIALNTNKKVTIRANSGRLWWNLIFFSVNFFLPFFCIMENYLLTYDQQSTTYDYLHGNELFLHRLASILYSNPSNSFFPLFSIFFIQNNTNFQYLHNTTR